MRSPESKAKAYAVAISSNGLWEAPLGAKMRLPSGALVPTGRILALAPAHQGATLSAEVHWMKESTFFQQWGQSPWAIVGGLLVGY